MNTNLLTVTEEQPWYDLVLKPVARPLKKKRGYSHEGELQVDLGTEDPEPQDNDDVLARYFRDIRPYLRILSHDEVRELCRKIHEEQDLKARNLLVLHNQRLLLKIARRYLGRGLEYADLVQEGQFGLLKTAERLNPDNGAFSTYAQWWVKQTIIRAIADTGSLIRSPMNAHVLYNKVVKIAEQVSWKLGRPPSEEEIAEYGGLLLSTVQKALHHLKISTVSLETPTGEDGNSLLGDFIADEEAVSPDEVLMQSEELEETREGIEEFLLALSNLCRYRKRDFAIFFLRYGLDNDFQGRTLEEVGKAFKMTRERVRQICVRIWKFLGKEGHWSEADLLLEIERMHGLADKVGTEAKPSVPFNGIDFSGADLSKLVNERDLPHQREVLAHASVGGADRHIVHPASSPPADSLTSVFERTVALLTSVYGVSRDALLANTRGKKNTGWARQVCYYLLRIKCEWSFPTIASVFGRDHTTVMHGCKLVAEVMEVDAEVRTEIERLQSLL